MEKEKICAKGVNGVEVSTKCKDVSTKYATLQVEVGSTGCTGCMVREGGSRAYVRIVSKKGDFLFQPVTDDYGRTIGIVIAGCGDSAVATLCELIQFCDNELNKEIYNLFKDTVKEFMQYREEKVKNEKVEEEKIENV